MWDCTVSARRVVFHHALVSVHIWVQKTMRILTPLFAHLCPPLIPDQIARHGSCYVENAPLSLATPSTWPLTDDHQTICKYLLKWLHTLFFRSKFRTTQEQSTTCITASGTLSSDTGGIISDYQQGSDKFWSWWPADRTSHQSDK